MNERDHAGAPPEAADERKLVTVMFADISGFTALSRDMDPEDVHALMNRCFDALVPAIDDYGGTVDKFIGDEIMAIFGAPVAYEDHVERALQAALDMQASLEHFNEREGAELSMHVGVNTGTVLAGGVGSSGRRQYSVMGDAVNLAARLKDSAAMGTILVGPATFRLGSPRFAFESLEPLTVKGRSEPVAVYRLRGRVTGAPRRGDAGPSSPLVGREAELSALIDAVDGLSSGTGSVIAIVGDPGLGKSRLIHELSRAVEARVRWCEGRALAHTERMNYGIAREVLRAAMDDDGETPPEGLAPSALPYLRRLAGLPLAAAEDVELAGLLPEALQRRMHGAFTELVRTLARGGPVVLAWEDLHWADPSSLGLLETILPLCEHEPLLVLLAFRTGEERLSEWLARVRAGRDAELRVITLDPLGPEESGRLIDNFLQRDDTTKGARAAILVKAEGNPFFLEEMLRSIIVDGPLDRMEVPDTLNGVIAARIDRLSGDEKRVLQTASVFGRIFARGLLAGLVSEDDASLALDDALLELTRREFLRRHSATEFIFKHALTQEVAYGGILRARRRELHAMAARVTASLFPAQLNERAAEMGVHYERAEQHEKAATFLTAAADRARMTFSNVEAINFYRTALEQIHRAAKTDLAAIEQRARAAVLHEKLADVFAQIGRQDDARASLRESEDLLGPQDRIGRSRLHRKAGTSLVAERKPADALRAFDRADQALSLAPQDDDAEARHEWIETQLERGWANYWLGRPQDITADAERLGPLVDRHGSAEQRASFLRNLVLAAFRADRYVVSDRTLAHAKASVEAAADARQPMILAHAEFALGFCHMWRDELPAARSGLEQALRLAERIGDAERIVLCLSYLTVVHRKRGDLPSTQEYVERSLRAAGDSQMYAYVALARANQAWLAWRAGDLAATREHSRAALTGWGQLSFPAHGFALWPLAGTALAEGRPAEAIEQVRAMLATDQMRLPAELERLMNLALESWAAGDPPEALTKLEESAAAATRRGYL